MRNTQPLTDSEIAACQVAWQDLSRGECALDVSEAGAMNSVTRFEPKLNRVSLGADAMPGTSIYNNRDELSYKAVLAHELTHFRRHQNYRRHGAAIEMQNYALEEVATHVQAAEIPGLSMEDRCALLRCGEEILMEYRMKECP